MANSADLGLIIQMDKNKSSGVLCDPVQLNTWAALWENAMFAQASLSEYLW